MQGFIQKITDWMLEKEESMAKECALPMKEIDHQIEKVEAEKKKLQARYDEGMETLDEVLQKLQKIKNIEVLRCQNKEG